MTDTRLSAATRRFLTDDIGSVERLNLLLFLHRHNRRWWSAQPLAEELGMPADTVQLHLEHLSACNLLDVRIAESVVYCYKPGRQELSELVEEVAQAHYAQRDAVVAVLARHGGGSAQLFADAFQIRKGRQDG